MVSPTYRGHAAYLAKGGSLRGLIAELYGKATGVAGGKGGSMHLIDMTHNVLGRSAVVGTTIPVAVGYALAFKRTAADRVAVAFFGDGATEEGVFTESLNFAALHKLPVLFVCENNYYAIHTPITRALGDAAPVRARRDLRHPGAPDRRRRRAQAARADRRLRSTRCAAAAALCSSNAGPTAGASTSARTRTIRRRAIARARISSRGSRAIRWTASARGSPPTAATAIDAEIEREIADAVAFAEESPFPDLKALYTNVFAVKPASAC